MFEIDYKTIKKGNKSAYLVIFIGLIITAICGGIYANAIIRKNSYNREAKATLINPNKHYDDDDGVLYSPIYAYTVNGEEYTCGSTNMSSSKIPSTESVVYYKKGDPKSCMTAYESDISNFLLIGVAIGGVALAIGIVMIVKAVKQTKKAKYLAKNGKLIKGIPYKMEPTGTVINGRQVLRIVIDYNAPNGEILHLKGYPRYDYKSEDTDGLVDLLIDPNDYNNYFIDFEIGYSGDVQVENYNGPIPTNNNLGQNTQPIVQEISNFVNNVENTVNQVNNVVNTVTTGTISSDSLENSFSNTPVINNNVNINNNQTIDNNQTINNNINNNQQ